MLAGAWGTAGHYNSDQTIPTSSFNGLKKFEVEFAGI